MFKSIIFCSFIASALMLYFASIYVNIGPLWGLLDLRPALIAVLAYVFVLITLFLLAVLILTQRFTEMLQHWRSLVSSFAGMLIVWNIVHFASEPLNYWKFMHGDGPKIYAWSEKTLAANAKEYQSSYFPNDLSLYQMEQKEPPHVPTYIVKLKPEIVAITDASDRAGVGGPVIPCVWIFAGSGFCHWVLIITKSDIPNIEHQKHTKRLEPGMYLMLQE